MATADEPKDNVIMGIKVNTTPKEELHTEFFKKFGRHSFRGYPLEQCWAIWEFFEPHLADKYQKERKITREYEYQGFGSKIENNTLYLTWIGK